MKTNILVFGTMLVTAAAFLTGCPDEKKEEKAADAALTTQSAPTPKATTIAATATASASAAPSASTIADAGKPDAAKK